MGPAKAVREAAVRRGGSQKWSTENRDTPQSRPESLLFNINVGRCLTRPGIASIMTYVNDLTPYRYGLEPLRWGPDGPRSNGLEGLYGWSWSGDGAFALPELSVGWLEPPHDFPRGTLALDLVQRLEERCSQSEYHATRGRHVCGFCGEVEEALGFAEIRLLGDGVIYAAPNLVAHYVRVHAYLPPSGFVEALRKGEPPPEPNAGIERPILPDMLPLGEVDGPGLEAAVREIQRNARRESLFPELAIVRQMDTFRIVASVDLQSSGGQLVPRTWSLSHSAFRNVDQAAVGVAGMLEAVYNEQSMALAPWDR